MAKPLPDGLVDAIYDAALDAARWPAALTQISLAFRGAPTQLAIWNVADGTIPLGVGVDFAPGTWETAARFATPATNPMLAIAMNLPLHAAVDQGAAIGIAKFEMLDVYADIYRPQNQMPLFGTVFLRSDTAFGGLALMRRPQWDLAGADDLALGERISVHVGRAVRLAGLFDVQTEAQGRFEAALSQARTPILLATAERGLVWTNPAAEALLSAGDGIECRRRRLFASDPSDDAKLVRALLAAARGRDTVLTVQRADAPASLIVRISPLWRSQAHAGAQVLIEVTETRVQSRYDPVEAADALHLTLGEAQVACAICAGAGTLSDVGGELNISVNTVKTLLHRIYDKTGVRSQADLSMVLASALRSARAVSK